MGNYIHQEAVHDRVIAIAHEKQHTYISYIAESIFRHPQCLRSRVPPLNTTMALTCASPSSTPAGTLPSSSPSSPAQRRSSLPVASRSPTLLFSLAPAPGSFLLPSSASSLRPRSRAPLPVVPQRPTFSPRRPQISLLSLRLRVPLMPSLPLAFSSRARPCTLSTLPSLPARA